MPLYLLDTNILIDLAGPRISGAFFEEILEEPELQLATSILCVAEFMAGAGVREEKFLKEWIQRDELEVFSLDSMEDAIKAGSLRKKHSITLPDALILATALRFKAHLLTHDQPFLKKAKALILASDPFES